VDSREARPYLAAVTRHFHKMHGLGNDFVILDARQEPFEVTPARARAVADRKTGVGCDQLILLEPSDQADLKMRIWNADGGEVQSCGNATRCVIALTGVRTIETDGGILTGEEVGSEVEVALIEPRFQWDEIPLADAMDTNPLPMGWDGLERPMAVNVGNPHLVFFVADADAVPLPVFGPRIEADPAFPERVNVNVAEITGDGLKLRTWERGTGLTLACGTGACASAVAAIRSKRLQSPVKVLMSGGSLTVNWTPGEPVSMRGTATHVFDGELDLEALD
jgi:diaminopimelate epimerase